MGKRIHHAAAFAIAALAIAVLFLPAAALADDASERDTHPGSAPLAAQADPGLAAQGAVQDLVDAFEDLYGKGTKKPWQKVKPGELSVWEFTFGKGYSKITWGEPNTHVSTDAVQSYTVELKHPVTGKWYRAGMGNMSTHMFTLKGLGSDYNYEVRVTAKVMRKSGRYYYCAGECVAHTSPGATPVKNIKTNYVEQSWENEPVLYAKWPDPASFKNSSPTERKGFVGELYNAKGKLVMRQNVASDRPFTFGTDWYPQEGLSKKEQNAIEKPGYRVVDGHEVCSIRIRAYVETRDGKFHWSPWSEKKTCVPWPVVFSPGISTWVKGTANNDYVDMHYTGKVGHQSSNALRIAWLNVKGAAKYNIFLATYDRKHEKISSFKKAATVEATGKTYGRATIKKFRGTRIENDEIYYVKIQTVAEGGKMSALSPLRAL